MGNLFVYIKEKPNKQAEDRQLTFNTIYVVVNKPTCDA
jgi:hypothetical protein